MKTIALGLVVSFALIGCSAEAPPTFGDGDDYVAPSKKQKKEADDSEDNANTTKSSTESPAPSLPPPAPSATPVPPPPPPPPPPVDTEPKEDPLACSNLGQCCSKITNIYGQLGCFAVQLRGDPETCTKALVACLAAAGLGSGP